MSWRVLIDKKILVAGVHFPPAVVDGINHRQAVVKGVPVTLFRHDYQTWRALRDRGLLAPSPICYYEWPGRFKPMKHQIETVEHFITYDRCFCLDSIGVGKTLSSIWAADYLRSVGAVRRVLVVAPLSTVEHVWERELFLSLPGASVAVVKGSRDRKRQIAADTRFDWIIVNPDSLPIIADCLPDVDLIIVDEFNFFKTARTRRYKSLRAAAKDRRLWLMSGTPAPQSPMDAYAPIRLIAPGSVSFLSFRDLTMTRLGQFRWVPRPDADKVIAKYMQPAIRHRREDCYELPDVHVLELRADLTTQQEKLIKMFTDEARALIGENEITAANAAAVLTKILQVKAGGVYDKDHVVHRVDASPYYETIARVLGQADTPVLVFVGFRSSAEATADFLEKQGFRIGRVLGGSGSRERAAVFDQFQAGDLDAIVAIPSTMSHGLNLTRARVVVWASPPFSFEVYEQANGRIIRKNQENNVIIYHLIQNYVDKLLFSRLRSKKRLQDAVLELISEEGGMGCGLKN